LDHQFEQWATQKINRLMTEHAQAAAEADRLVAKAEDLRTKAASIQAEAEVLQRTLTGYLEDHGRKLQPSSAHMVGSGSFTADSSQTPPIGGRVNGAENLVLSHVPRGPKPQKQEAVLGHLKELADKGVTLQEIHAYSGPTLGMSTNATRAMLWHLKQDGFVFQRDGHYYYNADRQTVSRKGETGGVAPPADSIT
jgi:hypothetical protein